MNYHEYCYETDTGKAEGLNHSYIISMTRRVDVKAEETVISVASISNLVKSDSFQLSSTNSKLKAFFLT